MSNRIQNHYKPTTGTSTTTSITTVYRKRSLAAAAAAAAGGPSALLIVLLVAAIGLVGSTADAFPLHFPLPLRNYYYDNTRSKRAASSSLPSSSFRVRQLPSVSSPSTTTSSRLTHLEAISSSASLLLATVTATIPMTVEEASSSSSSSSSTWLANALGYLVGLGSFLLYTPIAVRLFRQKSAQGTTVTTWMMKLSSYTCTDLYSSWKHYPLSTYIDTLIITVQAASILCLVATYQKRSFLTDPTLVSFLLAFGTLSSYLYFWAPSEVLAVCQLSAAALNSGALLPQFLLNAQTQSKGDYSPITAGLAATGCVIRLYTIQQLADNDPILLLSFGVALVLNTCLLLQILYYGVVVEGLSLTAVLTADVNHHNSNNNNNDNSSTADYEYAPVTTTTDGDEATSRDPLGAEEVPSSRFAIQTRRRPPPPPSAAWEVQELMSTADEQEDE
jgi:mannose-P-dolichol utilization defect protein 1